MGSLSRLEAESIGEPGKRTFRLLLDAGDAHCTLWLEKEQLYQLGLHLRDAVESLTEEERAQESQHREGSWTGEGDDVDFKAGGMGLSHDKQTNTFYISAFERENPEAEAEPESPLSISFWISLAQARTLAEDALRICAAGRPACFLCGQPIDPDGHVCPRSNGHAVLETG
ncbi:MAG: DUF3090 family protein [Chloroflexi bacterium]|nr:DUF3090 family protein [Chloroflexota bacterium]